MASATEGIKGVYFEFEKFYRISFPMWMNRGHILNGTTPGEACMAALETQRPKVTTYGMV